MQGQQKQNLGTDTAPFTLKNLFSLFNKYWKKIIISTFCMTSLIISFSIILPNKYTAKATLLPSGDEKEALGQYASLASLVGINLSSGGSTEKLYPDIITSNRILYKLYEKKWKYSEIDTLTSLDAIFGIIPQKNSFNPELEKKQLLVKHIKNNVIAVDVNKKTGFITITVSVDNDPVFASEFLNSLLGELEIFNRIYRKSKSTEEKIFLEKRLKEVFEELTSAEDKVRFFEENHRNWSQSPELKLEWQRLTRNVQVNTTMWIELKKQFELTKLSVEREKVTLNILDSADSPTKKDSPIRWLWAITGLLISLSISLAYFLSIDEIKKFLGTYYNLYKSV